jgi:hypothetical protein
VNCACWLLVADGDALTVVPLAGVAGEEMRGPGEERRVVGTPGGRDTTGVETPGRGTTGKEVPGSDREVVEKDTSKDPDAGITGKETSGVGGDAISDVGLLRVDVSLMDMYHMRTI